MLGICRSWEMGIAYEDEEDNGENHGGQCEVGHKEKIEYSTENEHIAIVSCTSYDRLRSSHSRFGPPRTARLLGLYRRIGRATLCGMT
jgi:hypothetical protein